MNQERVQRKKAPTHAETDARHQHLEELGDFTTTLRVLPISGLAIVIGAVCAVLALLLLRLIGLFTNLFYFGRSSTTMVSPVGNHLGIYAVFVPVIGALVIGVMARYGSERIRGHGIPEAIEAILINGSRVEPKVAIFETDIFRNFDRVWWTVWRGRANHYDGRGIRVADRAVIPFCPYLQCSTRTRSRRPRRRRIHRPRNRRHR